jgi:hypothetical protein
MKFQHISIGGLMVLVAFVAVDYTAVRDLSDGSDHLTSSIWVVLPVATLVAGAALTVLPHGSDGPAYWQFATRCAIVLSTFLAATFLWAALLRGTVEFRNDANFMRISINAETNLSVSTSIFAAVVIVLLQVVFAAIPGRFWTDVGPQTRIAWTAEFMVLAVANAGVIHYSSLGCECPTNVEWMFFGVTVPTLAVSAILISQMHGESRPTLRRIARDLALALVLFRLLFYVSPTLFRAYTKQTVGYFPITIAELYHRLDFSVDRNGIGQWNGHCAIAAVAAGALLLVFSQLVWPILSLRRGIRLSRADTTALLALAVVAAMDFGSITGGRQWDNFTMPEVLQAVLLFSVLPMANVLAFTTLLGRIRGRSNLALLRFVACAAISATFLTTLMILCPGLFLMYYDFYIEAMMGLFGVATRPGWQSAESRLFVSVAMILLLQVALALALSLGLRTFTHRRLRRPIPVDAPPTADSTSRTPPV